MRKETIYEDVIIDNYDEIEKCWTIDTYKTSDDFEEGVVVGTIDLNGNVTWHDESAKDDCLVLDSLKCFMENKVFGSEDYEKAKRTFQNTAFRSDNYVGNQYELTVISPDGKTSYNVELTQVLGTSRYTIAMSGMDDDFKMFTPNEEGIDEAISWLLSDIASAVGEVFMIEVNE